MRTPPKDREYRGATLRYEDVWSSGNNWVIYSGSGVRVSWDRTLRGAKREVDELIELGAEF